MAKSTKKILKDLQSAGNADEFYTPRTVTHFMVDMVDPKLTEKVLDPACGTGGFLTSAIDHIRKRYVDSVEDHRILHESIFGIEKKQLPHLLCITNMLCTGRHRIKFLNQLPDPRDRRPFPLPHNAQLVLLSEAKRSEKDLVLPKRNSGKKVTL